MPRTKSPHEKVRISLLLDARLHRSAKRLADLQGKTVTSFIHDALLQHCRDTVKKAEEDRERGVI